MTRIKTALLAVTAAAVLAAPGVAGASSNPWSYGPKGSCTVREHGHVYQGYKEYYKGHFDGRCVLQ